MTENRTADERRHEIAEALMDTVAEHGLERTTIRRVADVAGVSVGLVQRYFASKDDLLRFGIEHVYERARARVAAVPLDQPSVRTIIEQIAASQLPLDDARDREVRVWLAFVEATLSDPTKRDIHVHATRGLLDGFTQAFAGAQRRGEMDQSLDPRQEALTLVALVDGLALHATATGSPFDRGVIQSAVGTHLDRLLGGAR